MQFVQFSMQNFLNPKAQKGNKKTNARQFYGNNCKHKCFIDTVDNIVQVLIQNFLRSMECFSIRLELRWAYCYEFPWFVREDINSIFKRIQMQFLCYYYFKSTCLSFSRGIYDGNGTKRNIMKMKFENKI